jgi:glycerol kinase
VRPLTANREAAAVTQAAVAAKVHQTLDVHRSLTSKITFNHVITVDGFADLKDFCVGKLVHTAGSVDAVLFDDFLANFAPMP